MRLALVGADFEENVGVGMIAAAAQAAGHHVTVAPFNDAEQIPAIARRLVSDPPDVVGLSIQFQHRAHEFLSLARCLRASGFRGHITCGGEFPTLAWREVLLPVHGVDTVVLHEGERGIVELMAALAQGASTGSARTVWSALHEVPGLALRDDAGSAVRTEPLPLLEDLDELPFMRRYRPHSKHMGVSFIPLMGSRGCWGSCSYCSITSFYRDARAYGGGKTLRSRTARNLAAEMALLWHAAGSDCIYCFHDDNFLLPRPSDSLARLQAIRAELDELGVGRVGLIGKCRPETLTPELAVELRKLGVLRLYVGVENASADGAAHLNRATQGKRIRDALRACRQAGIFVCYNLLLFEPEAKLDDVRQNIAFIREHGEHPINFCRAEPYHGTPLHRDLAARDKLGGSYLGWNYRIGDDRTELLFRVCAAAFRQRNFAGDGVANRYMGLGYSMKLLEHFYDDPDRKRTRLAERAVSLTRAISLDTAGHLEEALRLVEHADLSDRDTLEREAALLGLRIAATDRVFHEQLDDLYADMHRFADAARVPRRAPLIPRKLKQLASGVMLGASLAVWGIGLEGCPETVADPVPPDAGSDGMVVDRVPADAGMDVTVVDGLPADAGMDVTVVDIAPPDAGMVVDAVPPDAGMVADPPAPDAGMVADPLPPDAGRGEPAPYDPGARMSVPARTLPVVDHWRDSTPRQARRTIDLPLHDPPSVRLDAKRVEARVHVTLRGVDADRVSTRWESDGDVEGSGLDVDWSPRSDGDQLRVAVRSRGGVAVVALRARDVD